MNLKLSSLYPPPTPFVWIYLKLSIRIVILYIKIEGLLKCGQWKCN